MRMLEQMQLDSYFLISEVGKNKYNSCIIFILFFSTLSKIQNFKFRTLWSI